MATGERIHRFRKRLGMTQRYLGQLLGFPANSADVRMAQYESEDRNPKTDLTAQMASIFGVSPHAISVPVHFRRLASRNRGAGYRFLRRSHAHPFHAGGPLRLPCGGS